VRSDVLCSYQMQRIGARSARPFLAQPEQPHPCSPATRLAWVRLNLIRLYPEDSFPGEMAKPLPLLEITEDASDLVSLLRPPVLISHPGADAHFRVIGNSRVIAWRRQLAESSANPDISVLSLVIDDLDFEVCSLVKTEQHLVPLVLGLLSNRKASQARKNMKLIGLTSLKRISSRARLKPVCRG
jgi:hypothetical protein